MWSANVSETNLNNSFKDSHPNDRLHPRRSARRKIYSMTMRMALEGLTRIKPK